MKLPRDMGGEELAALLGRYGYKITHQTVAICGSHPPLKALNITSPFPGTNLSESAP